MPLSDLSGSGSELSSRHIPDMDTLSSNTNISFSFQIPGTATDDNLLADEVANDFFRNAGNADVSLSLTHASHFSPAHTSPARIIGRKDVEDPIFKGLHFHEVRSNTPEQIGDPPFLSPRSNDHTPSNQRPKLSLSIRPVLQAVQTSPMTSFALPTLDLPTNTVIDQSKSDQYLPESKHTTVPQVPEIKTRPTKKKVDLKAKEQQSGNKGLLRTQRKIVEGGIAKSRIATTKKTREVPSRAVASSTLPLASTQLSAPILLEQPPLTKDRATEALMADSSSSSILPMTGLAGRLIKYGHKYIDSFSGQIDTIVPREKPAVNLEPDPTAQGQSIFQNAMQEREEVSSAHKLPAKEIADSLIKYRKKKTDPGTCISAEKISLDSDLQLGPINEGASVVQITTQEHEEKAPNDDIEDDRSKPLTLSQLSPRKQQALDNVKPPTPIATSDTDISPPSPMRLPSKRPIAESAPEERKLKKSKSDEPKTKERPTKPIVSKGKANSNPRLQSGPSKPQSRKPSATLSGSRPSSRLKKPDSSVVSKPAGIRNTKNRIVSSGKQAAVFTPGTSWNDNVRLSDEKDVGRSTSLKLSGSSLQNSRIQNECRQDEKALIPSSSLKCNDGQRPQPTPEESDSRSHSNSQSYKHKFYHPAPNFKAIHAALDASLAHRKENVHPTVPLPMQWETDSRMQQRKKFEERVREKEREKGKEEEERRRIREAEEERELKELRKKMVVKAHEVPEWYNERPKTKKRQERDVEN